MEEELIIVIDLDGTLISDEISQKIYREAYIETLKKMKERGIEIPDEFFPIVSKIIVRYQKDTRTSKRYTKAFIQ